jgi:hypothetical protein
LSGFGAAATSRDCGRPVAAADGWPVAAPADEGLDPELICTIGSTLERLENADPHAVVIIRHGTLVYEHYFSGGDEYAPGEVDGRRRL